MVYKNFGISDKIIEITLPGTEDSKIAMVTFTLFLLHQMTLYLQVYVSIDFVSL